MAKTTSIQLFKNIHALVEQSRKELYTVVNITLTETYFHVGRLIVEYEQAGKSRAAYAKEILTTLSLKLTAAFGRGFSVDNLENMRKFYSVYKEDYFKHLNQIKNSEPVVRKFKKSETASRKSLLKSNSPISEPVARNSVTKSEASISEPLARKLGLSPFKLSWTHYVMLLKIENPIERKFYEIEAANENWSKRELQRQYDSALFERLALSRDKKKVKELSKKGHVIQKPSDAIKDPYILEFLGLEEKEFYSENDLEEAIISKLEHFLSELGKGFLFVERQKRITLDSDDYKIDLVFYHRILRCFVLIDF